MGPPKPGEVAEACARLVYAAEDPARLVRHRGDPRLTGTGVLSGAGLPCPTARHYR